MRELTDLLEATRPDPTELRGVDVEQLLSRARARRRRNVVAAAGASTVVAVVAVVAVIASPLSAPGDVPRPDVATSPGGTKELVGTWTRVDGPLSPRHRALVATTSDGRVVVYGGAESSGDGNANTWRSDGAIYDAGQDHWTPIPPTPGGAAELASGRFGQASLAGDRLLVLRTDGAGISGAVYDIDDERWIALPPTSHVGAAADAVTWDGDTVTVLKLGFREGLDDEPAVARWTRGDDTWRVGATPPGAARNNAAVAFSGTHLFVWGGSATHDSFEAGRPAPGTTTSGLLYDVQDDTWSEVPDAPLPTGMLGQAVWLDPTHVAVVTNDGVVEPGEAADATHQVAVYETTTGSWARFEPIDTGLARPFFTLAGSDLARRASGGFAHLAALDADRPQSFPVTPWSTRLAVYDPSTGLWSDAPDGGAGHLITIGDRLAATTVPGGNPGDHAFGVAARIDGVWRSTPSPEMRNRLGAGIAADDHRLLVFGGMAGRDLELQRDLWILDLGSSDAPGNG